LGGISIITIGCKVNQAESQELAAQLVERGYDLQTDPAGADVCVVNTCCVTGESDHKSRKAIGRALRGAAKVVATGCMVDAGTCTLDPRVVRVCRDRKDLLADLIADIARPNPSTGVTSARSRAFVKIQDGCDRRCSYCIVPQARGASRSRSPEIAIHMVEHAVERGSAEIVLTGVNLADYREPGGGGLGQLIGRLTAVGGLGRLRLSSLEVDLLDPSLLEALLADPRVCPHFHLPLQSGDPTILRAMHRRYSATQYLETVELIREHRSDAAITTDVMVGFPGEGEAEFENTLSLLRDIRPARTHVFRFSARPGTLAATLPGMVDDATKARRAAVLRQMARSWQEGFVAQQVGTVREVVLIDTGKGEEGTGLTENYVSMDVRGLNGRKAGELLQVRVTGAKGVRAEGEAV
jgi:threonylcarbamoyladenosine tRNA methylthiotransferase MtaB